MTEMRQEATPHRHPWLDRLVAEPDKAVDALLRGVAHLPGLQRASPCEALMALMGDLPADASEWLLLDQALCAWLKRRRDNVSGLLVRPGGVRRLIGETAEAFRAVWRLQQLPVSANWVAENLLDLLRWAETFRADPTFDLAEAVLAAAAHLQRDKELRFLWYRVCDEAGTPRLRHRLSVALLGLSRMRKDMSQSGGPACDVVAGLARWASHLPPDDRHKGEVVREWRTIKATFPRLPSFWRHQWEAIKEDPRNDHPFTRWLHDADQALKTVPNAGTSKREPLLPKDISGLIRDFSQAVEQEVLTRTSWLSMQALLDQVEHYAEVTGATYYTVTSCTNIANVVLPHAPGHALALARRALLWAPSDGHAWSVRARALEQLGHTDMAMSVLWEGLRRTPSHSALANRLGLLLVEGRE